MPNGHISDLDIMNNKLQDLQREIEGPGSGTVARVLENAHRQKAAPFKIGSLTFRAHGDRALILEDDFRSGYECDQCHGKQKIICTACHGSGVSQVNAQIACKLCLGMLMITCPKCDGKGGLLIVPDVAMRRPTTGTIMSIGPGAYQNGVWVATTYQVGDRVVYSNHAGYVWDIDGKVVRILHEIEIFSDIDGHLTLTGKGMQEMPDSPDSLNASMIDRGRK